MNTSEPVSTPTTKTSCAGHVIGFCAILIVISIVAIITIGQGNHRQIIGHPSNETDAFIKMTQ